MSFFCGRCQRWFPSCKSLLQHLDNSSTHHECPKCDFDGPSWDALLDHCRSTGCRTVCQDCDGGHGSHWEPNCKEYWEHVLAQNVCTVCEGHFKTKVGLDQHKNSHVPETVECLGCYRKFKTYGSMILHLQSGTCPSNNTFLDLNAAAAECRRWREFLDEEYHADMLREVDLREQYVDPKPFICPTCETALVRLSGLFHHVESGACAQGIDEGAVGTLKRFLGSRYR